MRFADGFVEAPRYTLHNTNSGNQVDLVTLVHYASPPYYDAVRELADAHQDAGGLVHYEDIGTEPAPGLDPVLRQQTEKLLEARRLGGVPYLAMGLTAQRGYLEWGEGWQCHDAPAHEVARDLGDDALTAMHTITALGARIAESTIKEYGPDEVATQLKKRLLPGIVRSAHEVGMPPESQGIERRIVEVALYGRNNRQLRALDQAVGEDRTRAVMLLWSSKHIAAFLPELDKRGYQTSDERWIPAFPAD